MRYADEQQTRERVARGCDYPHFTNTVIYSYSVMPTYDVGDSAPPLLAWKIMKQANGNVTYCRCNVDGVAATQFDKYQTLINRGFRDTTEAAVTAYVDVYRRRLDAEIDAVAIAVSQLETARSALSRVRRAMDLPHRRHA